MAVATATETEGLTKQEKWLRGFLWFIAAESVVFVGIYISGGLFDGEEFRFVTNSAVKDFLFVMLAGLAATDVRRYLWAAWFVLLGHVGLIVVNGILLIFTDQADVRMLGAEIPATTLMVGWMAIDAVIVVVLYLLMRAAQRARFGLTYLGPTEFSTLTALAEVLIDGPDEKVSPTEIAQNVDDYLTRLDARGKGIVKLSYIGLTLFPLLYLRPPLAVMPPAARREFVKKRFLNAVGKHKVWFRPLREVIQGMIRAAQQFVFLGYYGDPRSYEDVGYKRFSDRGRPVAPPPPGTAEVETTKPQDAGPADVIVIGSGAAGAIIAHRLAEENQNVLVLDRGPYIPPAEISDDEVSMYLRLYNEGALQLARDFRFTVLQGMAIGGSTLVNNAVCFRAPKRVQKDWNERWQAGLELEELSRSYDCIEQWFDVRKADLDKVTPGYKVFYDGVKNLGLGEAKLVDVNIADCQGCGYCNIGCQFDRKKSTLVHVLPAAQKLGKGRVEIIPDCRVDAIESADGHASGVVCEVDGTTHRIEAKKIVVSAGAVNSSVLLLNSGIKRGLAGERLHFNIVTPLTADTGKKIDAYDGLQISHYWDASEHANGNGDRFILETWFNPPATHSLVMPGWFDEHYRNMRRYDHMAAAGVVVGTTGPGRVKPKKTGPDISYTPAQEDLDQVIAGMKTATRILLAGGAERVMPQTYLLHELGPDSDLDEELDQYATTRKDGLGLNSAHPQGGNPISTDWRTGVVDENFRVHGMDNVYVCDASVFPTSVTVNPQLTVMALADYASKRILASAA